jgi:6-pyruvoyltetrahydropterin/6-carboxytetrahydropterin synthase
MYTITKEFSFSASHILEGLPEGHKCGRLHGHNYVVILELAAPDLNSVGFVVDYGDLQPFKDIIDNELDHKHLNDVVQFQTSAEHLANWLFARAGKFWDCVAAVRVSETAKTWAEFRR